jgi:sulfide:quinone oxidoreductase
MTCVGYYGASSGLAGNCEVEYDEKAGKWKPSCYLAGVSPIIRLMKEAFYKAWIASLK